jgi:hypothetical protein
MLRCPYSTGILEILVAMGLVGSPILTIEEVAILFSSVLRKFCPAVVASDTYCLGARQL